MNINIIITRLEYGIDAVTTPNDDGTYTIAINSNLCEERARKALLHEITHIKNDDFSNFEKASLLERMLRESNYLEQEVEDINFYWYVV